MEGGAQHGGAKEVSMAQKAANGHSVEHCGAQDLVVKKVLQERARYRAAFAVAIVSLLLCFLTLIASSSANQSGSQHRPRAIVLVVPHLHSELLEAAMASNWAPNLDLFFRADGTYSRIRTGNMGAMSSLVSILTGIGNSSAVNLVGSVSFLKKLKTAGMRPVVLASSAYWSAREMVAGVCGRVGLFDSECSGLSCPEENAVAYCNAAEKLLACDGKAQLYGEDVLKAFHHLLRHDGDLLYAHVDFLSGADTTIASGSNKNEEYMATMSDMSIMDGMLGRLALAVAERTRTTAENWLVLLVGAGAHNLSGAPLAMSGFSEGRQLRLGPIADNATLTDIHPTLLHWYGLANPDSIDRVFGICSTGALVRNCDATASQV